ncbi:predicted protein [Naegleria gruberi]|uniref:Cap-specific mRNA (nucleoside-2'-O-)-methyltransferase 1 n=1 Tax=Naegleria gruberi TaxID=5762 RepID=D2VA73_NAEGR|nr:uncharacterized protein NAEGRDRAFT_65760 [Naegleria gruberi]EFC46258.1 predicted protein [Naegleria gruberi]|eukprot:XP_002679002.1 predicted protein [Naegleria gruberi strain NEG-M]
MGYKEGEGLGKFGQGNASVVNPQVNTGRGGLGTIDETSNLSNVVESSDGTYKLPSNFQVQRHEADPKIYSHKEEFEWIACKEENRKIYSGPNDPIYKIVKPESDNLDPSKMAPNDANEGQNPFIDPEIMKSIFKTKADFDDLPPKIFLDARLRSNPYEKIGKSIFQNRAAVKLANIDLVTDLTSETSLPRLVEENGVLYFADICAGPGGFTEYLYYRYKTSKAKGWGFTLKNDKDDWKLEKFNNESPCSNFELNYGVDGTGDITKNENMLCLDDAVNRGTNNRGLALVTADGGFCVDGVENSQEYLTQQLVLCQFLTALLTLRKGGCFVCKLFDLNTWFSASLIYVMYQYFEKVTIFKPFSSRPANSERYIVCKGMTERKPEIIKFLLQANTRLSERKPIKSLVDCDVMTSDKEFAQFMTTSNNTFSENQDYNLKRLKMAIEDRYIDIKDLQYQLQQSCLKEWNLPESRSRSYNKRSYDNYRGNRSYDRDRNYSGGRGGYGGNRDNNRYDNRNNDSRYDRHDRRDNNDYYNNNGRSNNSRNYGRVNNHDDRYERRDSHHSNSYRNDRHYR